MSFSTYGFDRNENDYDQFSYQIAEYDHTVGVDVMEIEEPIGETRESFFKSMEPQFSPLEWYATGQNT